MATNDTGYDLIVGPDPDGTFRLVHAGADMTSNNEPPTPLDIDGDPEDDGPDVGADTDQEGPTE